MTFYNYLIKTVSYFTYLTSVTIFNCHFPQLCCTIKYYVKMFETATLLRKDYLLTRSYYAS